MHAGTLIQPVPAGLPWGARPEASVTRVSADRLATLFELSSAMVHRTAWRITGRREDAEDVLQSVFLHVLRNPPVPWPDHPEAYLHRAAVNTAVDVLRRRRRRSESPVDASHPAEGAGENEAVSRLEEERLTLAMREALPLLSPLEAEVFSLRFFEDKSNAEIAHLLGKTANHVGVALHAARHKLRQALSPAKQPPQGGQ